MMQQNRLQAMIGLTASEAAFLRKVVDFVRRTEDGKDILESVIEAPIEAEREAQLSLLQPVEKQSVGDNW